MAILQMFFGKKDHWVLILIFFIYSGNESTDSGHHSGTAKKCVKTDSNSSSPIGKISDKSVILFLKVGL